MTFINRGSTDALKTIMSRFPEFLSDTSVTTGSIPTIFDNASAQGVLWQAASGRFQLDVPNVARYLVEAGTTIIIDPAPDALASSVKHHLGMLPLAALVYQRGLLAFHAAAVANDQGAVLLAGDSRSGKSTLLTALLQRGWKMLADDLAIVDLNGPGQPIVYSTASEISLWPDSLTQLGIDADLLPHADANRYEYMPPAQASGSTQPLRGIYRVDLHGKSVVELEKLTVSACFRAFGTFMYNSHVADALCDRVNYMRCTAAIAQAVPITVLRRPRGTWSVNELADMIEERHINLESRVG